MNESRKCELCGRAGADAPLHLQTDVGTFALLGSYAHGACIATLADAKVQS